VQSCDSIFPDCEKLMAGRSEWLKALKVREAAKIAAEEEEFSDDDSDDDEFWAQWEEEVQEQEEEEGAEPESNAPE